MPKSIKYIFFLPYFLSFSLSLPPFLPFFLSFLENNTKMTVRCFDLSAKFILQIFTECLLSWYKKWFLSSRNLQDYWVRPSYKQVITESRNPCHDWGNRDSYRSAEERPRSLLIVGTGEGDDNPRKLTTGTWQLEKTSCLSKRFGSGRRQDLGGGIPGRGNSNMDKGR